MITRKNYEEYFLLYVDNELSADQRRMVEAFIRDNSDLATELAMIQQVKMHPEKIYFEGRESLLKQLVSQGSSINHTNYEGFFVLYADGELNDSLKKEVELFVSEHPALESELELFIIARVHPDTSVVFEEKETLYKKQEPAKRVFLPWYRMAAAAILLLVAGFLVFNNRKPADNSTAKIVPATTGNAAGTHMVKPVETDKTPLAVTNPSTQSLQQTENTATVMIAKTGKNNGGIKTRKPADGFSKDQRSGVTEENIAMETGNKEAKAVDMASHPINPVNSSDPVAIDQGKLMAATSTAVLVVPAIEKRVDAFTCASPDEPWIDGNPSIYTSKKPKMRGIFRKVSRVFEKTANVGQEDGKSGILIGSFQIAAR